MLSTPISSLLTTRRYADYVRQFLFPNMMNRFPEYALSAANEDQLPGMTRTSLDVQPETKSDRD